MLEMLVSDKVFIQRAQSFIVVLNVSGIAYMFLRLHQSRQDFKMLKPLEHAQMYIQDAKNKALSYAHSKSRDERCAFLCGNAGIYSVSAVISFQSNDEEEMKKDLRAFASGFEACKPISFSKYGSDEILGISKNCLFSYFFLKLIFINLSWSCGLP